MKTFMLSLGIALLISASGYGQFCDPPGEFVGTTLYPIQSLLSSSNRITIDNLDGVGITWTNYSVHSQREVFFNFRNEYGEWSYDGGLPLDSESRTGYPSISLFSDDRTAIAFHGTSPEYRVKLAIDLIRGFGIFELFNVPNILPNGNRAIWPHISVSANGDIHILMTEIRESGYDPYLAYTRSENGGYSWSNPVIVDSILGFGGCITSAPDGKVAIVYLHPTDWENSSQLKNDVCYFVSPDGREWDFSEPECITDYGNEMLDTYCPWGIDAVFDFDGYLNAIWITGNINENGQFIDDMIRLWHYSERTGEINLASEMTDPDLTCDSGGLQIDMPTISVDSSGAVEVIYAGFDDTDVSVEGDCVGDLYMVYGGDFGRNWLGPFNITATHSPGCLPGDCQSESQPSTAEIMADSVYLTYVMQRFDHDSYPPDTVYYMPVAVPYWVKVENDENVPTAFRLHGNYPNPFNFSTAIEFEIEESCYANLTIYDITGGRVAILIDDVMEAGLYSINWDAGNAASGVYYYSLKADGEESTRKMTLLK